MKNKYSKGRNALKASPGTRAKSLKASLAIHQTSLRTPPSITAKKLESDEHYSNKFECMLPELTSKHNVAIVYPFLVAARQNGYTVAQEMLTIRKIF